MMVATKYLGFSYLLAGKGSRTREGWARAEMDPEDVLRFLMEHVGDVLTFTPDPLPAEPARPQPQDAPVMPEVQEWEPAMPGRPAAPAYVPIPDDAVLALPEQAGLPPAAFLGAARTKGILAPDTRLVVRRHECVTGPLVPVLGIEQDTTLGVLLVDDDPPRDGPEYLAQNQTPAWSFIHRPIAGSAGRR